MTRETISSIDLLVGGGSLLAVTRHSRSRKFKFMRHTRGGRQSRNTERSQNVTATPSVSKSSPSNLLCVFSFSLFLWHCCILDSCIVICICRIQQHWVQYHGSAKYADGVTKYSQCKSNSKVALSHQVNNCSEMALTLKYLDFTKCWFKTRILLS